MKYIPFLALFLAILYGALPAISFVTTYENYPEMTTLRPELDQDFTDPTFGSHITRITDSSLSPGSLGVVHEYSRYPILSADNKLIVAVVVGGPERGQWQVRGMRDHIVYNRIETNGDPEFSWHPTDPTRLFFRFGNTVRIYHTDTSLSETIMTFDGYTLVSTNEEGRPDDLWNTYAVIGVKPDGTRDILVADLKTKTIIGKLENVGEAIDWVSISPDGKYVVVMRTDGQGTLIYDRNLTNQRQLMSDFSHSDFALNIAGEAVLVYVAVSGQQVAELGCPNPPNGSPIASARLSDGKKTILLGDCNTADWKPVITGAYLGWGGAYHFSGIISRSRPGWILVSSYADPSVAQEAFSREIFLVNLDGSGDVERLAHHHSLVANLPNGERDYLAEPHASSSEDGSLVFFVSTWGATGMHYDLYVLEQTEGDGGVEPLPVEFTAPYDSAKISWAWGQGAGTPASGFRLQCGTNPQVYLTTKDIKDPTRRSILLRNIVNAPGKYYCVVSALGAGGASVRSGEIIINAQGSVLPPAPPTSVTVSG